MQEWDDDDGALGEHLEPDGDGDAAATQRDRLEREGRAWSGGRGFDESGYGYGAYGASDDG